MASSAFYSSETACLEGNSEIVDTVVAFEQIWGDKQKELCKNWINENSYKKVCLQFPDNNLVYSTRICDDLKKETNAKIYILADTSYGSCCVDEIAAAHVEADSIIHFGDACKSEISRLPVLYVFPHLSFDWKNFEQKLSENLNNDSEIFLYFDIPYQYLLDEEYKNKIENFKSIFKKCIVCDTFTFNKDNIEQPKGESICIFVGQDNQSFFNLSVSVKDHEKWCIYDPIQDSFTEVTPTSTNWIRRRYFYIEKCKDAQTLGLIVATLTANGYLEVVKHIQQMARSQGIKTHIISVGRINPAKLANFMEIDCFVLIGCPFNNLYTSRDFYKPIVSVFEAEMALNPVWRTKIPDKYSTDFRDILPNGEFHNVFNVEDIERNDVSLVTGRVRNVQIKTLESNGNSEGIMIERKNFQLTQNGGAKFEDRTWKGLQPDLGLTEPAKIEKGLSGIPISYE